MRKVYLICRGTGMDQRTCFVMSYLPDAVELVTAFNRAIDRWCEDGLYIEEGQVYSDVDMVTLRAGFRFWFVSLTGKLGSDKIEVESSEPITVPNEDYESLTSNNSWLFHGCSWALQRGVAVGEVVARLKERLKSPDFGVYKNPLSEGNLSEGSGG